MAKPEEVELVKCRRCGIHRNNVLYTCRDHNPHEWETIKVKIPIDTDEMNVVKLTTQSDFFERFVDTLEILQKIVKAKNQDYAESHDAFANFKFIEQLTNGRISVEDGIIARVTDKLKRVSSLLSRSGAVDEKIDDTLLDMANYCVILYIWLNRNKPR